MEKTYRSRIIFITSLQLVQTKYLITKSELEDELYQVLLLHDMTYHVNRHVEVIERIIRLLKEQIKLVRLAIP